jgi:hypothetical protein
LEAKFKGVPTPLAEAIRKTTDEATLKHWLGCAGLASSLEQFKQDAGLPG